MQVDWGVKPKLLEKHSIEKGQEESPWLSGYDTTIADKLSGVCRMLQMSATGWLHVVYSTGVYMICYLLGHPRARQFSTGHGGHEGSVSMSVIDGWSRALEQCYPPFGSY